MAKSKNVKDMTFEEITKPLVEEAKRLGLKESDAVEMVHRFRRKQRKQS
jgi:DNA-binding transcriptional regulator YhcF (GntR family)